MYVQVYHISLQEKAELELKTSMESLKDELSNLQSQIMMKTTQNQKLSENNVSLTKHLNKLKEKEKMVSLHDVNELCIIRINMHCLHTYIALILVVCLYLSKLHALYNVIPLWHLNKLYDVMINIRTLAVATPVMVSIL